MQCLFSTPLKHTCLYFSNIPKDHDSVMLAGSVMLNLAVLRTQRPVLPGYLERTNSERTGGHKMPLCEN